jgi:hypothetical protein
MKDLPHILFVSILESLSVNFITNGVEYMSTGATVYGNVIMLLKTGILLEWARIFASGIPKRVLVDLPYRYNHQHCLLRYLHISGNFWVQPATQALEAYITRQVHGYGQD